eukprot:m.10940 g.10940  ORF g.10940 m.10940 type:complete len:281 (-) comp6305_c1_seq1:92-934(-)
MGVMDGVSIPRLIGVVIGAIFIMIGSAILWNYVAEDTSAEKDGKASADWFILTTWFVAFLCAAAVITGGNLRKHNAISMVAMALFAFHFTSGNLTSFSFLNQVRSAVARSDDPPSALKKQLAGSFFTVVGMIICTFSMAVRMHISDSAKIIKLITAAAVAGLSVIGIIILWSKEPLNTPQNTTLYGFTAASMIVVYATVLAVVGTHRGMAAFLLFLGGYFSLNALGGGLAISETARQIDEDSVHAARAGMLFITAGALVSTLTGYLVYQDEQSVAGESSA